MPHRGEHLFDEIKRYVGFGAEDEALLRALRPRLGPHVHRIIDDFYDHILGHSGARGSITGGDAQVQRLKGTLRGWMDGLFTGPWDMEYYELRARIGRRHVQIDLPQQYMFTAVNVIRGHIKDVIIETAADRESMRREMHAVDKLLDMELAIMLHTYREDYLARMQRTERLATFGQLVASIGHELRNPLGVMESSLFLLRGRVGTDERVTRHLEKIETQIRVSNRIISDMLDIVRDRPVARRDIAPGEIVRTALEMAPATVGSVQVINEVGPELPAIHVDPDQVRQIFVNLIGNAADAAGEGGTIRILASRVDDSTLELVVNDSGPGIDPAIRTRLFEPLVTTKQKGIGLGLPLCRRIAERNGGSIMVTAGPLPGAAFAVRLPLAAEN